MSYYCAIDGGGTQTRCAIADATRVLGEHTAPSAKPARRGYEESGLLLFDAILAACADADVPFNLLKGISIGMSGVWTEHERSQLREALYAAAHAAMYPLPRILLASDIENAVMGALGNDHGVVVISGTGSVAIGRNSSGALLRVGGYGPELGDEGSGAWIGRAAFQHMVRAVDGREQHTELTRRLASILQIHSADDVRVFIGDHRFDMAFFAELAPCVFEHAMHGLDEARDIIHKAAEELCLLAHGASAHFSAQPVPVCFLGSIAEQELMSHTLRQHIQADRTLQWAEPRGTALDGALARARSAWMPAAS